MAMPSVSSSTSFRTTSRSKASRTDSDGLPTASFLKSAGLSFVKSSIAPALTMPPRRAIGCDHRFETTFSRYRTNCVPIRLLRCGSVRDSRKVSLQDGQERRGASLARTRSRFWPRRNRSTAGYPPGEIAQHRSASARRNLTAKFQFPP